MSKLAIYLRLSVEDYQKKEESESIHNQRAYIRNYLKEQKDLMEYEVSEYVDDGFSGTGSNRPAYQRLLDDLKNNQISTIVVKDMSRFSRDYIEMGNYLENIFPFMGIRFISINDAYDSQKEGSNGTKIDTQFKSLLYDFYSKELSQKMRSISQELKSQGKNTNGLAPFGYLRDPKDKYHILVDEKTAFIVKEAFELILQGYSCRKIARIFNEKGYITGSERKEELGLISYKNNFKTGTEVKKRMWQGATISRMTGREIYTGDYVYNRIKDSKMGGRKSKTLPKEEWKKVPNTHEAIISREVFNKVQEIKQQNIEESFNKDSKKKYFGVFEGKLFCKECGRKLLYREDHQKTKNGISTYRKYYCEFCKANQKSNIVKEKKLEELFLDKIKNIPVKVDRESVKTSISERDNISCELIDINLTLQKQYEKYKKKELQKEKYLEEKQKLLLKKQKLENELEKASRVTAVKKVSNSADTLEVTKGLVDTMVEKIMVSRYGGMEIELKEG